MSRPSSIKIFGQKYKVKYDLPQGESDILGMCDQATSTISIQPHLQEDKMAGVLMHEITHACIDESVMSGRKRFNVEEVCDIVGYHVLVVLKDNPRVLEWLIKEIEDEVSIQPTKEKSE